MRRLVTIVAVVLTPLLLGAGWSGEPLRPMLRQPARIEARRVVLHPGEPRRRQAGALTFLGGVALSSPDRAFGGFSALNVHGERFTLVADGGGVVRFSMGRDWKVRDPVFQDLPGGPWTGWTRRERDAEALAVDPKTGRAWVAFEAFHQIWRFSPGLTRAERGVAPAAMARWRVNGGAESFTRLADGRFVAISESPPRGRTGAREGLVWAGDPTERPRPAFRFGYLPSRGHDPVDMAELPDGRLLVLERGFDLPFRWSNRVMLVERGALRPGATVRGRLLATLAAPLIHDNFEGIDASRERRATILWLVSDDNRLPVQRTLLLKFRMDG